MDDDITTQRYLGESIVDDILGEMNDDPDSPWGLYGKDVSQKENDAGNIVTVKFTNERNNTRYSVTIEETE